MSNQDILTSDSAENRNISSIQVGLSTCLASSEVRDNRGQKEDHTRSRLCLDLLSKHFDFITFCPEVSQDLTEQFVSDFKLMPTDLGLLDGYIVIRNAPSSEHEKASTYQPDGLSYQASHVIRAFKNKYPLIPIEEEERLNDDALYDNFVLRIYAHNNFRREVLHQPNLRNLLAFHSSYKYMLMAHNQRKYKDLGRLLGSPNKPPISELIHFYFNDFMQALAIPASKKNHTNTLLHILGYLKKSLSSPVRQNIVDVIYKYKDGITPLETPLNLLTYYLGQYGSRYINEQRYLNPYPKSLHPISRDCH
jgi:uncharacterized protein YbgA (DUF1722 family)/uncharacterized protein YbbK (DUF523 family)